MNEVTVIIPNYRGMNCIRDCLLSLESQEFRDFDTIVVDNCSGDGSAELVEREFPRVRLVRLSRNFGFSRAVNEGIRLSKTPFVLLLNNDTKAEPSFVGKLLSAVREDKRIFSVSAKMLQMNHPDLLDGAGDLYSALGWAYARGKDRRSSRYSKRAEVFSACAGAAIYRRSILERTGLFDEAHFAYLEDLDIGYRARIMGYRNLYEPEAVVYHQGSGATGSRYNEFKVRISARNNLYVIMKNMPFPQILLNLPFLCIGFGIKFIFFTVRGYGKPYLSGLKQGCRLCRKNRRFPYSPENFRNYARIQLELLVNMFRRF